MKKGIPLILVLVVMVGILCSCRKTEAAASKPSLDEQVRIAANNMSNDSHFATNGEFLFCSDWDDGIAFFPHLLKVRLDDFTVESTYDIKTSYGTEFSPNNITCIDNVLYYYDRDFKIPYAQKTDMAERMQLPFSYFVTDGEYYYVSDWSFFSESGIYRVGINEITEETKSNKALYTKISDLYANRLILQGQYLYVVSGNLILDNEEVCWDGLWRMDLDGGNPIQILEASPRYLLVAEDQLYVVEEEDCIYSMNLDGSDRKVLAEAYIDADNAFNSINISGKYIFYRYAENGTLHRVNTDGTNDVQLNECNSTDIVIADDWVIYLNEDDWNYYKMHFDGSSHCLISEAPTVEKSTDEKPADEKESIGFEYAEENDYTVAVSSTTKETEPPTMGDWTLEECKNTTGIFIAHEDGSFTRFYGGGYLDSDMSYNALGMFMQNDIFEHNPTIGKDDKLVLFCDSDYSFEMVPVNWQAGVLYHKLDDGTRGYTLAVKSSLGDIICNIYYDNHEIVWSNIAYIDGIPIEDYPFEIVQGGPDNTTGCGFPKDSTVKIGVVNGSAIVEETFEVSATYFDCLVTRDTGGVSDDEYFLYPMPTTDGYAVIDIYDGLRDREVPSGSYVLVLRMGRRYIAYLLNWENS